MRPMPDDPAVSADEIAEWHLEQLLAQRAAAQPPDTSHPQPPDVGTPNDGKQ